MDTRAAGTPPAPRKSPEAGVINLGTSALNAIDAFVRGSRAQDVQDAVFHAGYNMRQDQLAEYLSARDAADLAVVVRGRIAVARSTEERDALVAYAARLDALAAKRARWAWYGGGLLLLLLVVYWYMRRRS